MFHVSHTVTQIYESTNSQIHPNPIKIKIYTETNYAHNKLFKLNSQSILPLRYTGAFEDLNTSQVNLSSVSQKKIKI